MALHKVKKGLELPINGAPEQAIYDAPPVSRVALLARDYVELKPKLRVQAGDRVLLGEALFEDRKTAGLMFVAPAAGHVEAVHRGERRALLSVVIRIDSGAEQAVRFASYTPAAGASRETAQALLLESGLWTALRARPYSRTPAPDATPHSIFVTAIDTHPLAPRPEVVLAGREAAFQRGLSVLKHFTQGPLFLCRSPRAPIEAGDSGAQVEEFAGKHPAGTVGYHIHVLDPVHRGKHVWHIGYQDVARIGHLFATGELDTDVVIALAGPLVQKPRLVRTRLGASTTDLLRDDPRVSQTTRVSAPTDRARVISGSALHGDKAHGEQLGYLGRFHNQITVLSDGSQREFLGWLAPGANKFSIIPTFLSALLPQKGFDFDTRTHGSRRAMVPIGLYERVMPMDLMPTHLLRALTVGDAEWAEELGALELDEEDLALCTFVCPGKYDYGPALRRMLTILRSEDG